MALSLPVLAPISAPILPLLPIFSAPPSSQKASVKPISFLLWNQSVAPAPTEIILYVRPEDLTRTDPSRVAVQQTLGGAFGDSFGPGLTTINISGVTGWHPDMTGADGVQRFLNLKSIVFDQWHINRQQAVASGYDPNLVQLIYLDYLDNIGVVVIPNQFVLRRSKSRPLLMQYQISMTVVQNPGVPPPMPLALTGILGAIASGLASLEHSIAQITAFANQASNWINSNLLLPVQLFTNMTAQLFSTVEMAISSVNGVANSLINVAGTAAQAGANLFNTLAAVVDIPMDAMAALMAVASAYTNVVCLLSNALTSPQVYPDYTPIYGSSNCSSTAGGSPVSIYANSNPFYDVAPITANNSPITMTTQGATAMSTLAQSDPVLAPMSTAAISQTLQTINAGVALA